MKNPQVLLRKARLAVHYCRNEGFQPRSTQSGCSQPRESETSLSWNGSQRLSSLVIKYLHWEARQRRMVKIRRWVALGREKVKLHSTGWACPSTPIVSASVFLSLKWAWLLPSRVPERIRNKLVIKLDTDTRREAGKDVINKWLNTVCD